MNKVYVTGFYENGAQQGKEILWASFKIAGDAHDYAVNLRLLHPQWRVTVVYK